MDKDVCALPHNNTKNRSLYSWKHITIVLIVSLLIVVLTNLGSFYIGRKSVQNKQIEKSIQFPEPTLVVGVTNTPSPTMEASVAGSITPIKKGSPTPSIYSKTMILKSLPKTDGFITSDRAVTNANDIRIGDNGQSVMRGFVSFDLSPLPQGVQIGKATVRLYQAKVVENPFSIHGSLQIDYLTYGETLDADDYGLSALSLSFAAINQSKTEGWKEVDVTSKVKEDLANARSLSQFRIHFTNETVSNEKKENYVSFESAENANKTGNTPQLVVSY